jgi:twinkle protein
VYAFNKNIETEAIDSLIHVPCGDCGSSDGNAFYLNSHPKFGPVWQSHCFACGKSRLQKEFKELGYDILLNNNGKVVNHLVSSNENKVMGTKTAVVVEEEFIEDYEDFELEENEVVVLEDELEVVKEEEEVKIISLKDLPFNPTFGTKFDHDYRGISLKTRQFYNMELREDGKGITEIYNYSDAQQGHLIGQKLRNKSTENRVIIGKVPSKAFYGQNLFPPNDKKSILIVEGELDALSAFQMLGGSIPVVSLSNGAQSAKKTIQSTIQYIDQFKEVVFCFDPDDAGRSSLSAIMEYADYTRWKFINLAENIGDINDYLTKGFDREFKSLFYNAQKMCPEGILYGENLWEEMFSEVDETRISYPFPSLQEMTYGWGEGEISCWTAQTGQGKSAILKAIIKHLIMNTDEKIGLIILEENTRTTLKDLAGLFLNKRIRLPGVKWTREEVESVIDKYDLKNRIFKIEGSGSQDFEYLERKIRELSIQFGCKTIILDHISMITSDQRYNDERQALDMIATRLQSFVAKAGVRLAMVAHLNRNDEIRGTSNIEKLVHLYIYMERNKERNDDPRLKNITRLTVRKNRFGGECGFAGFIEFQSHSGDMFEVNDIDDDMFYKKPGAKEGQGNSNQTYKKAS